MAKRNWSLQLCPENESEELDAEEDIKASLEYLENNLEEVFDKKTEKMDYKEYLDQFDESGVVSVTIQLCEALISLHKRHLFNGDLHNLDNILIRSFKSNQIAYTDFGCLIKCVQSQRNDITNLKSFIYKLILKRDLIDNYESVKEVKLVLQNFNASENFTSLMIDLFENKFTKVEQILYSLVFDVGGLYEIELPYVVSPSEGIYKNVDTIMLELRPEHENIKFLTSLDLLLEHTREDLMLLSGTIEKLITTETTTSLLVKLPNLRYKKSRRACDILENALICKVLLVYSYIDRCRATIFEGKYTFLPNTLNKNNEVDKKELCITRNNFSTIKKNSSNVPSFTTDNKSINNQKSNCTMTYNDFKYKMNKAKENFRELSKLRKCPLGFSILSHYISLGLKEECISLIELGYDPNEIDTLQRTPYYWADYYKYENKNTLDSHWLKKSWLKYRNITQNNNEARI
ncbi:hypothetical protein ABK040_008762 [Willaertia magna]